VVSSQASSGPVKIIWTSIVALPLLVDAWADDGGLAGSTASGVVPGRAPGHAAATGVWSANTHE
jgi:hypothetical protein